MALADILREPAPTQAPDAMEFPPAAPSGGARAVAPPPMAPGVVPTPSLTDVATRLYGPGGAREQEAEQARIRANALRPEYAKVTEALANRERLAAAPPAVPTLAPPPSRGLRDFLATSENESPVASIAKLLQAMSLFATVVPGRSRHSAMGALAAFTGAMKGWQEGDAMRADRAFADWQAQTSHALKQYDLQRTAYNDALTASGLSLDGRMRAAQLKALEFGDQQAVLALESKNLEEFLKFQTAQDKAVREYELEASKVGAAWAKALQEKRPGTLAERYARAERRARENPNDPQAQADFAEAKAAMAQEEKLAGIKAAAAAGAPLGLPLTPKQAEGLIHPQTLAGPPAGMTMADVIRQGYVETDEKDRAILADLKQTKAIVGTLTAMTDKLITATTPSEALAQRVALEAGAMTGSNALARAYRETRASFLGTVSRALAGERGVLTEGDLKRIAASFPDFFDTKAVAAAKVGLLNLLISTAHDARVAKMTKQPIDDTAIKGQIKQLITALEQAAAPAPGQPGSPWKPVKR